jgi:hypothetical protein
MKTPMPTASDAAVDRYFDATIAATILYGNLILPLRAARDDLPKRANAGKRGQALLHAAAVPL